MMSWSDLQSFFAKYGLTLRVCTFCPIDVEGCLITMLEGESLTW
jgi:hypothetical protein